MIWYCFSFEFDSWVGIIIILIIFHGYYENFIYFYFFIHRFFFGTKNVRRIVSPFLHAMPPIGLASKIFNVKFTHISTLTILHNPPANFLFSQCKFSKFLEILHRKQQLYAVYYSLGNRRYWFICFFKSKLSNLTGIVELSDHIIEHIKYRKEGREKEKV